MTHRHHQMHDSGISTPLQSTGGEDDDPELAKKMRLYPQDFLLVKPQIGTFGFAWARGVVSPFVSSKRDKMDNIFAVIGSLLTGSAVVMDVGCGDGAFLLEAARFGCQCYGLEIDAVLAELAREKAKEQKKSNLVQIFEGDLFDVLSDLNAEEEGGFAERKEEGSGRDSHALVAAAVKASTVFYFYLLPAVLDKLTPWLFSRLERARPGHLTYIFNTWAPASAELETRFLAPPYDRAEQSKRGFFLFQS